MEERLVDATPDGWEGILDPGERILWQGRPYPRVPMNFKTGFLIFWTLLFCGIPGTILMDALRNEDPFGVTVLFTAAFVVIGLVVFVLGVFGPAVTQKGSWYTLTNRRAIVTTLVFGRRGLTSYPIDADTVIELHEGNFDHLYFATTTRTNSDGDVRTEKVGFVNLDEARVPYRLMRDIQAGSA